MRKCIWQLLILLAACAAGGMTTQAQTIRCTSDDGGKKYCEVDTSQGVRLVKRLSTDVPCPKDSAWGYDEKGIWVDHGCDAEFALGPETAAASSVPGAKILTCTSDGGRKYCDARTGRGVRLVKQRSEAQCKKDVTWGYDGLGIWVDGGCSADFELGGSVPASSTASGGADGGKAQDVSCLKKTGKAHADMLVKQCLQVSPATHPPCNSGNSCELIEDEIRRSCALLGMDAPAFCGGYK
jgi:Protein of unknown function (DUF3011)